MNINLVGANLYQAALHRANLSRANLGGASLRQVNLRTVKRLRWEQIEQASLDGEPQLPSHVLEEWEARRPTSKQEVFDHRYRNG